MITLIAAEADKKDVGRWFVRLAPDDMAALGAQVGDVLLLNDTAVAKAMPAAPDKRGQSAVYMDGTTRSNAGVSMGDNVDITLAEAAVAEAIALRPHTKDALRSDAIHKTLLNHAVKIGNQVRINRMGANPLTYTVAETKPEGAVLIGKDTHITVVATQSESDTTYTPISYEDIGGLDQEIHRIREMVELPMRFPQVFEHLGISPPTGLLLHGPPGSGKTLIARALARETNAHFVVVNGPEIIDKYYGQSEGALRRVFEEAQAHAPSIIFIDEIDAIAPRRERVQGEVEKRVVAQLLTLMDGLEDRGQVVVIAATNLPENIDPALRRPGRFDREIALRMPDVNGREAILLVHTRGMPLAPDVDIQRLATQTHGYVGADLQALCREAAMSALRRFLATGSADLSLSDILSLTVDMVDFETAIGEVIPSATRGVYAETPNVHWDDVGGLNDAKAALQQAIEFPLHYRDLFAQANLAPPKGILLSGAPGTGKTLLAKAVASASQVNFISVRGPELLNKYVGESERGVRDVFRTARLAAPCVVFFDEFDSIAPPRTGEDPVAERVVAQLLAELDGLEEMKGVIVLAATNRPDLIDNALLRPGRLDIHIEVGLPDAPARAAIFDIHTHRRPLAEDVDVDWLVTQSEGWSGAAIAEWCRSAAQHAVIRAVETDSPVCITFDDFLQMMEKQR